MYDRVLLPTDMSAGIDHTLDVTDRYDAELHILYVVDAKAYSSYPGDEYVTNSKDSKVHLDRPAVTPSKISLSRQPTLTFQL